MFSSFNVYLFFTVMLSSCKGKQLQLKSRFNISSPANKINLNFQAVYHTIVYLQIKLLGNLKFKKKLFHEWTKYFPHFPLKPNKGNMEWMECHLYFMMKPSKSSYIQLWLSPLLSQNTQIGSLTWNAAGAASSSFNFFFFSLLWCWAWAAINWEFLFMSSIIVSISTLNSRRIENF